MRATLFGLFGASCLVAALLAQDADPRPTCDMCPADFIDSEEVQAYVQKAIAERRIDQQIRDVNIGKAHLAVGVVHRPRLTAPGPNPVAEHDLVSEVYHVISGGGTLVTGPDLVGSQRRPADLETVRLFNGPGHQAASIRNPRTFELTVGDVVVIPAGTGHYFSRIDDHITYLMIRLDPDKVTPLKNAEASKAYLSGSAR